MCSVSVQNGMSESVIVFVYYHFYIFKHSDIILRFTPPVTVFVRVLTTAFYRTTAGRTTSKKMACDEHNQPFRKRHCGSRL